jgi:hypothetical protein
LKVYNGRKFNIIFNFNQFPRLKMTQFKLYEKSQIFVLKNCHAGQRENFSKTFVSQTHTLIELNQII